MKKADQHFFHFAKQEGSVAKYIPVLHFVTDPSLFKLISFSEQF
jgi:hypothetical protein